ncbi:hypothetical protein ACKVEX_15220 [Rhodocyclaceae bacterium SMB388]
MNNLLTNPAALAKELRAVMAANDEAQRDALASRLASQMLGILKQPAPPPVVTTRFAGIDQCELTDAMALGDAIRRRLAQVRAINRLMSKAAELVGEVPDDVIENAGWAVADLSDEAEELTNMLQELVASGEAAA